MTTTETWLIIGVIALIVIVPGLLWGAYHLSRQQRRTSTLRQQSLDGHPPETTVSSQPRNWENPAQPQIRWGDDLASEPWQQTPSMLAIRWGSDDEQIEEPISPDPSDCADPRKCPLCRNEVRKNQSSSYLCQCGTLYHQQCREGYGNCPNCEEPWTA